MRLRFLPLFLLAAVGCQSETPPSVDGTFNAASLYDGDGDGQTPSGGDCDDGNPDIYAGAPEYCDGADNDCDGLVDDEDPGRINLVWMFDGDTDGYGRDNDTDGYTNYQTGCDPQEWTDIVNNAGGNASMLTFYIQAQYDEDGNILVDCNDENATVNPAATEVCDGLDNDCNELIDDGVPTPMDWYADTDGDLYGDPLSSTTACEAPMGYVADNTDCNDGNVAVNPAATEVCDPADVDENCNSFADDNDAGVDPSTQTEWFVDDDSDGYGDPPPAAVACDDPTGGNLVSNGDDCDDSNLDVHPGATEACNGIDDDCDGVVPAGETDNDSDGLAECQGDCDDGNPLVNPAATEACNNIDDDCDGEIDEGFDLDFDGFTNCAGDCDDADDTVYPGAPELCDDQDNDCDPEVDEDAVDQVTWSRDRDDDFYGDPSEPTFTSCDAPSGYTEAGGDCDDFAAAVNPGATEVFNGIDDDCDGETDEGTSCMTSIVIVNDGGEAVTIDGVVSDDSALDGQWYPSGIAGVSVTPTSLGGDDWEYEATMNLCLTPTGTVLVDAEFMDSSSLCEWMMATAIVFGTMDAIELDVVAYDNGDGTCQVELSRP